MEHSLPLISTLVIAFSLALVFGFLAERLFKAPPLVGYLLAGIAAGKYTPTRPLPSSSPKSASCC